jgi:hypothetical protein
MSFHAPYLKKAFIGMMESNNYSLQYVISLLATHSFSVKKIIDDPDFFHEVIQLNDEDTERFEQFMAKYGEKLLTCAMLNEKKRWESLQDPLLMVRQFISRKYLIRYWSEYLISFDILTPIPESPGLELVAFLAQILQKTNKNMILERSVIAYELIKNKVLLHETPDVSQSYPDHFRIDEVGQLCLSKCLLHPSIYFSQFTMNITMVISKIQSKETNGLDSFVNSTPELLLFSKKWTEDAVVVLKASEKIQFILQTISAADNLDKARLACDLDEQLFIRYMNMFLEYGLLKLIKVIP